MKPFRFTISLPTDLGDLEQWTRTVQHIEELGFHGGVWADHFTDGYDAEPFVGLTAAASVSSHLRLITGVLGNDYRHPVLTHRSAALLDVMSGGRLVLGLGAGWMTSDYEAAGIPLDRAGIRVDRFAEAVKVIQGLFAPEPFSFDGEHYRISELVGRPAPVSRPRPPFFLGGGSPRVLRLAGALGDIVGINASLAAGELGRHAVVDLTSERVAEKIGWVREGAESAGRSFDDVDLEMNNWLVRITETADEGEGFLSAMADRFDVPPELLADSPSVLVGTLDQCCDTLRRRRDELGISWVQLDAGFFPKQVDQLAPLVERLAGE